MSRDLNKITNSETKLARIELTLLPILNEPNRIKIMEVTRRSLLIFAFSITVL
jgi:hypothetical protein